MGTLNNYERLRAYWFNPKGKKIELRIRDTRDFGTFKDRSFILAALEDARARLGQCGSEKPAANVA